VRLLAKARGKLSGPATGLPETVSPDALIRDAGTLGVTVDPEQAERLRQFVALLSRWNQRFNLISRQDMNRIWPRHVLDSLSVLPLLCECLDRDVSSIEGREVLDAGTGAGFPGLPLAVAAPQLTFHLMDRNARKIRFLEMVSAELGLRNVRTHTGDFAAEGPPTGLDAVVSRAVMRPAGLARSLGRRLAQGGVMLLLSGAGADASTGDRALIDELPPGLVHESTRQIVIPGLDRPHEVTIIRQTG
jgi:16S rRNA (guanine527-N7)-methyltransferase